MWTNTSKSSDSWSKQGKSTDSFTDIDKTISVDTFLLLEDGGFLTQQNGDGILLTKANLWINLIKDA